MFVVAYNLYFYNLLKTAVLDFFCPTGRKNGLLRGLILFESVADESSFAGTDYFGQFVK